jgi:hypothetical protein
MSPKKPKTGTIHLRVPVLVLAQLTGIAAYAGVTVEQVINVFIAADLMRARAEKSGKP